jgi:hypothetical protein
MEDWRKILPYPPEFCSLEKVVPPASPCYLTNLGMRDVEIGMRGLKHLCCWASNFQQKYVEHTAIRLSVL